MWMNLESVIQSEVSQKEREREKQNKTKPSYQHTHTYIIQKNGTEEPIYRDIYVDNGLLDTGGEGESGTH